MPHKHTMNATAGGSHWAKIGPAWYAGDWSGPTDALLTVVSAGGAPAATTAADEPLTPVSPGAPLGATAVAGKGSAQAGAARAASPHRPAPTATPPTGPPS